MIEIKNNSNEFTTEGLAVVDFWAPWCGPCKALSPIIDELSEEVKGASFYKVNSDENLDLAKEFGIRSIPTILIMKNGVEVDKFIGMQPKHKLEQAISKHIETN